MKWKNPEAKSQVLYDSTYIKFEQRQNSRDKKQVIGAKEWGWEGIAYKEAQGTFCSDGNSIGYDHGGDGYMTEYVWQTRIRYRKLWILKQSWI